MTSRGYPHKQGLYDPQFEHDACGIGFVAHIKNQQSHEILQKALTVLRHLDHRGAQGSDPDSGDGAGVLLQIPHAFFLSECSKLGFDLPPPGEYGVGMLFLPGDQQQREVIRQHIQRICETDVGQRILGWRHVPVNHHYLGKTAKSSEPFIAQVFIAKSPDIADIQSFEQTLYTIRKRAEQAIQAMTSSASELYFCSLSARTIVYKGMLTTHQLPHYFPDLQNPTVETSVAIVHSRFSTNTFPSWERAQPCRYVVHNGEINTLRGNVNWMLARLPQCQTTQFGLPVAALEPILDASGSDSALFDNTLEFLVLAGRSLPHAAMMMIPEPWSNHQQMSGAKRAFYEYHSCLMEPWDGPAAMVLFDGRQIVALLDRNGLRPARYTVTKDDVIVLASETGVLDASPADIVIKNRLAPGRMLVVDLEAQRIIPDDEVKTELAEAAPYRLWLDEHLISLSDLPDPPYVHATNHETILHRQVAFGYTHEDLTKMVAKMATDGADPTGAMGADIPLSVLSHRPQLLYHYFKQLFAQVTNPPIDAIREEIVTATTTTLGPERNLLCPEPASCRQIELATPILTNEEFAKLIHLNTEGRTSATLPILFPAADGEPGLTAALTKLCHDADAAIDAGVHVLVLSDRGVDARHAAIPALLAVSGLHNHLIRGGRRTQVALVIESGEPREVHHFALLIGYGASAINPYLALESLDDFIQNGFLKGMTHREATLRYVTAVTKGLVKVLSKMGISTIQSYHGAQIFEAIGLSDAFVEAYFTRTPTRISGIGLSEVCAELLERHRRAFDERLHGVLLELPSGGRIGWRPDGEKHLYTPETIHLLQQACQRGDYRLFKAYSQKLNQQDEQRVTLRSLLQFQPQHQAVPIDEVESVDSIVRRFKTGAMSYGSISQEAHESLAIAMNRLGGKSNSGEGGEDAARFEPDANGDSRRSAIKQVASGRFGVSSHYLVHAKEIQIKIAQGAKPGEGGQLPGSKVYPWIAKVRHSTPGVGLISPPPHHDVYSIEDLAELIHDLKCANPEARISVKLVSAAGVGTIASGVVKGKADVVLISGHDGGTGASPQTSIQHAGMPWEVGLAETHQTLLLNGLRDRVVLETDGKLMTGRDVVVAALLGAEEFGFSTAPLVTLGCVMMRVCHLDTCPVGIATQNPKLRENFTGDPAFVETFMRFVAQETRELMAMLGFRTFDELVGRTDCLVQAPADAHTKASMVDLSSLLYQPVAATQALPPKKIQHHELERTLDVRQLFKAAKPALEDRQPVHATFAIRNTDRAVGTLLGNRVTSIYGADGLPEDTIRFQFRGSAGQSFAAFLPSGLRFELIGDANDYVGKGLSGGRLIIKPPKRARFCPEDTVIIGNVAFYGATAGDAYVGGQTGERFCVRNSGLTAVVEGVGDHGCEYMTGGHVVILGPTGRNFAAGMSGGFAYVWDDQNTLTAHCNPEMVDLERLPLEDDAFLQQLIERHFRFTGSHVAQMILDSWPTARRSFRKVVPKEYRKANPFCEQEAVGR